MDGNFWTYILLCFTSFFTLVNPLGIMPVFLTMTQSMGDVQRKKIVRKSTVIAFLTLVSFTVFGRFLFMVFGLSTNGFRLAGGIVIFKIGWDMLQAKFTRMKLADTACHTDVVWSWGYCQWYRVDGGCTDASLCGGACHGHCGCVLNHVSYLEGFNAFG